MRKYNTETEDNQKKSSEFEDFGVPAAETGICDIVFSGNPVIFPEKKRHSKRKIMRNGTGKTRDILLMLCLIAGGFCLLFFQCRINHAKDRRLVQSIACAAHLKQIGTALLEYAGREGAFPDPGGVAGLNLLNLRKNPEWRELFLCPASALQAGRENDLSDAHCSYHYFSGGAPGKNAPKDILVIERAGNHENFFNVLFADGSVGGVIPETKPAGLEAVLRESYRNDFSTLFRLRQLETARMLDRISIPAVRKKE